MACGPGASTPIEGEASTGSLDIGSSGSTGAASSSVENSTGGSSTGSIEPVCEPDLARALELVQTREVQWTGSHAAASERGEVYLAGVWNDDVRVARIDDAGAELWSATWGSTLGWNDRPNGLFPVKEGVFVTGVSGHYPSQEYPSTGTSFVRGYSTGGVVRWTWEDSDPSFSAISARRDGPVSALGAVSIAVAAPVLEGDARVGIRLVALNRAGGAERSRAQFEASSAEPHAAWVNDTEEIWVAATTADGSVMLRWDETGAPSIDASSSESLYRHASFYPDGTLLDLSAATVAGDDGLRLRRYARSLQLEREELVWIEGFRRADLWDFSATFGCNDVVWISLWRTEGSPVVAVDAALDEIWTTPGLGSVAAGGEAVAFAGYDAELESAAIWQMEWAE